MGSSRHRPVRLGEKLAVVRARLGLNMSEMAERVSDDKISVRRQDVFRFEKNEREPPVVILLRYSRLARVKMEIFADDDLDLPK